MGACMTLEESPGVKAFLSFISSSNSNCQRRRHLTPVSSHRVFKMQYDIGKALWTVLQPDFLEIQAGETMQKDALMWDARESTVKSIKTCPVVAHGAAAFAAEQASLCRGLGAKFTAMWRMGVQAVESGDSEPQNGDEPMLDDDWEDMDDSDGLLHFGGNGGDDDEEREEDGHH